MEPTVYGIWCDNKAWLCDGNGTLFQTLSQDVAQAQLQIFGNEGRIAVFGPDGKPRDLLVAGGRETGKGKYGTLWRVGIVLDKSEQGQLEALVAQGDTLGAQEIILAKLQAEFDGPTEHKAG